MTGLTAAGSTQRFGGGFNSSPFNAGFSFGSSFLPLTSAPSPAPLAPKITSAEPVVSAVTKYGKTYHLLPTAFNPQKSETTKWMAEAVQYLQDELTSEQAAQKYNFIFEHLEGDDPETWLYRGYCRLGHFLISLELETFIRAISHLQFAFDKAKTNPDTTLISSIKEGFQLCLQLKDMAPSIDRSFITQAEKGIIACEALLNPQELILSPVSSELPKMTLLPSSFEEKIDDLATQLMVAAIRDIREGNAEQAKAKYLRVISHLEVARPTSWIYRAFCFRGLAHLEPAELKHKNEMYKALINALALLKTTRSEPLIGWLIEGFEAMKEITASDDLTGVHSELHAQAILKIKQCQALLQPLPPSPHARSPTGSIFTIVIGAFALLALLYVGKRMGPRVIKLLLRS